MSVYWETTFSMPKGSAARSAKKAAPAIRSGKIFGQIRKKTPPQISKYNESQGKRYRSIRGSSRKFEDLRFFSTIFDFRIFVLFGLTGTARLYLSMRCTPGNSRKTEVFRQFPTKQMRPVLQLRLGGVCHNHGRTHPAD